MPFIRITLGSELSPDRRHALAGRATDLIVELLGKRREVTAVLADALTGDGYVASVRPSVAGEQLCQHHCPVAHVAERFPQLCEAETEAIGRVLGTHVQRLATIAHGDGVCTTCIPESHTPTRKATT